MTQLRRVVSASRNVVVADATANDSDKTLTVPAGKRREVLAIHVVLVTTATPGNRQLRIDFRDSSPLHAQDETNYDGAGSNGSFVGGADHAGADVITLDDATLITVDNVTGGVVDQFTVDSTPTALRTLLAGQTLTQTSTDGSGTGFTLTLGAANLGNVLASVLAGAVQAESTTRNYSLAPGLANLTSAIGTELSTPLPPGLYLEPGFSVRAYDSTAVAAAADDMTMRVIFDEHSMKTSRGVS